MPLTTTRLSILTATISAIFVTSCAPSSGCDPSSMAGARNTISTYGGYMLWPTQWAIGEDKGDKEQQMGVCTSVIELHNDDLYVATTRHCLQDMLLDQLAFNSLQRPELIIEFEKSSQCSFAEPVALALTIKGSHSDGGKNGRSATENAGVFTAKSEDISQMKSEILDAYAQLSAKENRHEATAKIQQTMNLMTEYFTTPEALGYKVDRDSTLFTVGTHPLSPKDAEDVKSRLTAEKDFHREACGATGKSHFNQKHGLPDSLSRACFLSSDTAIFELKLSQAAHNHLKKHQSCLKPQSRLQLHLAKNHTAKETKDRPWIGMQKLYSQSFLSALLGDQTILSQKFKSTFSSTTFDSPKVEYAYNESKQSNFGVEGQKLLFQSKIRWPNLAMLVHLEQAKQKEVGKIFQRVELNRRRMSKGQGYVAGNLVMVKQRWGMVVFYHQEQYKIRQGVSGALLITAPSRGAGSQRQTDYEKSQLIGALHSVDGEHTRGWSMARGSKKISSSYVPSSSPQTSHNPVLAHQPASVKKESAVTEEASSDSIETNPLYGKAHDRDENMEFPVAGDKDCIP